MPDNQAIDGNTSRLPLEQTEQRTEVPYASGTTSEYAEDRTTKYDRIKGGEMAQRARRVILWTPKRCRWDPENPPKFTLALNLLFGFVGCFSSILYCS